MSDEIKTEATEGTGFFDKLKHTLGDLKEKAEEVWEKVEDKAGDAWEATKEKAHDLKEGISDKVDGIKGSDVAEETKA